MRVIPITIHLFIHPGNTMGNEFSTLQQSGVSTSLYLYTAICFALIGFLFIIVLYTRRILISAKDNKIKELKFRYQYLIYEALIESQNDDRTAASQLIVEKLKKDSLETDLHKQVLADLIIDLKKNFSGESAKQFIHLYQALNLSNYSLKKLEVRQWDIQAKGIRELTEMDPDHYDTQLAITGLRYAKNRTVAQEAQIACVRLEKSSLSFLNGLQQPLTEWQQISLHHSLLKTDRKSLPDFTRWLTSSNESVVLFSLKMIADFEQKYAEPQVVQCLQHVLISIREEAIRTLIKLHTKEALPQILYTGQTCSETVFLAAIKATGLTGSIQHVPLLEPLLQHHSINICQEAERAIARLKLPFPRKKKIYPDYHQK